MSVVASLVASVVALMNRLALRPRGGYEDKFTGTAILLRVGLDRVRIMALELTYIRGAVES